MTIETASVRAKILVDPVMSWKKTQKSHPMQVPDYVANPDVFDGQSDESLVRKFQIRSQQHYALTRERPSLAIAESVESVSAHVHQLETEIINRGLVPSFTPIETSALPQTVYSSEATMVGS